MKIYSDIDKIRETDEQAHVLVYTVVSGATVQQAVDLYSTLCQEARFKAKNFKWLEWAKEAFIETQKEIYIGAGASSMHVNIAINEFVQEVRNISGEWLRRVMKEENEIVYADGQIKKNNLLPMDKMLISACRFSDSESVNKRIILLLTRRYDMATVQDVVSLFNDTQAQGKDIKKLFGFGKRYVKLIREAVKKNYGIEI